MPFSVRPATLDDIPGIAAVAAAAWRDTYAGLLRHETIETFIERAYAAERLARRVAADTFLVAVDGGAILAFCDALASDDRVELFAIYVLPEERGRGAGTRLLAGLRERFPDRPIAAEVLSGNRKGETFYEARGFVPRERIETELFGELVTERRWWLVPEGQGEP
jgi:GNAT superfamily N-acetyltransferase